MPSALSATLAIVADLVAISALTIGLYHRRHGRRDLIPAFFALNVGVLAVTFALTRIDAGIGLGLGLFGILSIIRLRSDQIGQEEVAYYFTSLALGLIAGIAPGAAWVAPALCVGLVTALYAADHPRLFARSRRTRLTLSEAYPGVGAASEAAARLLGGADIRSIVVEEVDLVREVTVVDVRYTAPVQEPLGPVPTAYLPMQPAASARA